METMPRGLSPDAGKVPSPVGLMIFSIGGQKFGARTDEIIGVRVSGKEMPIPSRTPFIRCLTRHGDEVLPVYDLAARLKLSIVGARQLCLIARHQRGPLAIRIDAEVPTIRPLDASYLTLLPKKANDILGSYQVGAEAIPIYSLATLGLEAELDMAAS